ncbi:MAG TPA: hypothetical protein VMW27_12400 [Thermoanaerobaculia bacterium]|nr:hypothetical protein [Thermoanaerobaculia bacterium]
MTDPTDLDLMRLLHGELPEDEARALRARLRREPELAALYQRLERSWQGLELPPPQSVPLGFRSGVMSQVRQSRGISWAAAPTWVRAAAAAALVTGLAVGAGVGRSWTAPAAETVQEASEASEEVGLDDLSLADSYWQTVEDVTAGEPEGEKAP